MAEAWYAILWLTLGLYVILDGWDIGAGVLHHVVAKSDEERRLVIRALGPFWSWNEVWLVATGGVLAIAFPVVLATAFSGFYIAMIILVWCLLLRGISIEFAAHATDRLWRAFWDFVFALSNVLLAVLFGAAFGNLIRGVPLDPERPFSLPLFTDFRTTGSLGILDWYTTAVAIFALAAITAHGAAYLATRTEGAVRERSVRVAHRLWFVVFGALPLVTLATWIVRPELGAGLLGRPLGWAAILVVASGAAAIVAGARRRRDLVEFAGSVALLAGLVGGAAASVFPVILHSSVSPAHSLTAHGALAGGAGPRAGLVWWPFATLLAIVYVGFVARYYRGRARITSPSTTEPY
jgi:cytochrome d ubiquinol oxidase subunit II